MIKAKRDAGIYGPKRTRRNALIVAAGVAAPAMLIATIAYLLI